MKKKFFFSVLIALGGFFMAQSAYGIFSSEEDKEKTCTASIDTSVGWTPVNYFDSSTASFYWPKEKYEVATFTLMKKQDMETIRNTPVGTTRGPIFGTRKGGRVFFQTDDGEQFACISSLTDDPRYSYQWQQSTLLLEAPTSLWAAVAECAELGDSDAANKKIKEIISEMPLEEGFDQKKLSHEQIIQKLFDFTFEVDQ